MVRVKDVVRDILFSSETASDAFFSGVLNLSAYAKMIRPRVEELAMKGVTTGNIVVALSRLSREEKGRLKKHKHDIIPRVFFNDITVRSSLNEYTFNNTVGAREHLKALHTRMQNGPHSFSYVATGISEITIISDQQVPVRAVMAPEKPIFELHGLCGITVRFDETYMTVPNTLYAILRILALHFVNVIEIVSTYTELSFIVEQKEMTTTFELLKDYCRE